MADNPTIIKVENVSKVFRLPREKSNSIKSIAVNFYKRQNGYEPQEALSNISLEVKRGDFFGVAGRNGSGKSTLLKILASIYTPTKGTVEVTGALTPFIELGVGFNPELTGRENVFLNGALLGFNRREMKAKYKDIVDFAELEKFMDQKLKNYSSGMQVRLAFSIAVQAKSDILLIDEVLAVGDAAFQQKCFDYFEDLKSQGQTVVFVSHDMSSMKRFCNRAVYIKDGKLIHDGSAEEVSDLYMADNISVGKNTSDKANPNKLNLKIVKQDKDSLTVEFRYKSTQKQPLKIGMSIINAGVSIAEISTPDDFSFSKSGKITYTLDTTKLNAGVYRITSVLWKKQNQQLLCLGEEKPEFMIGGNDPSRGGAVRLEHSWKTS